MVDLFEPFGLFSDNVYINSLVVLITFFISSRLVVYISQKVFLKFALKTKSEVDDLIIKRTNSVVSLILLFIGLRIAILPLSFAERTILLMDNVIKTVLYALGAIGIGRTVDILINNWGKTWAEKTESTLDDQLIDVFQKITNVIVMIFGLLIILYTWNVDVLPLLGSLGIAGLGVALALQGTLSNIFGGISVLIDRTVKAGDVVELDDKTKGKVIEVGLRSTKISTFNNELIIIPNSKISEAKVINYALPDPSARTIIPFGVAYGNDIDKVKEIVLKQLNSVDLISKNPEPNIRFSEMGDHGLKFKAYFWVDEHEKRFLAKDMANTRIYNALRKNGIEMPNPQFDINLRNKSVGEFK